MKKVFLSSWFYFLYVNFNIVSCQSEILCICFRKRQNAGNNQSLSPQREHTTLLDAQKSGQSSPNTDAGAESVELQSH